MTAPIAKVDALLAARIAPWAELLSPKAPAGGGPAQAVLNAPRADNDVLLPQGTALRPQAAAAGAPGGTAARPASSTDLSSAARVILDVLADRPEQGGGPVRASTPVWPAVRQAPMPGALAASLSQQVSGSGLFYESHLAQFAAGARSLAQMQREPQAALANAGGADAAEQQPVAQPHRPPAGEPLPMAASPAPAAAVPTPLAADLAAPMSPGAQQAPGASIGHDAQTSAAVDVADLPQAPAHGGEKHAAAFHASSAIALARYAESASSAGPAPAATNAQGDLPAAAPAVHPQAAPLLHQQLDLLASAMFRWSGEAWPGVPMEWSVQEEGGRSQGDGEAEARSPQWSTALTLQLPRLGEVGVRMQLNGMRVRARLAAPQPESLMQLRVHRATLSQRMAAAGFELHALQLDAEMAA